MTATRDRGAYVPGIYSPERPDYVLTTEKYMEALEKRRRLAPPEKGKAAKIPPTICFSRKLGSGALEIADRVATRIGSRVADRLVLEQIATSRDLSRKTAAFFDERYPGMLTDLAAFLFGEKSFTMGDYTKALFGTLFALAENEPTIFVGRGAHLVLPRDRVLAVRCICSQEFRVRRVAHVLEISESQAARELEDADKIQREFFKKIFNKKEASPYEFDLVINTDCITDAEGAAEIVATAFRVKFRDEVS